MTGKYGLDDLGDDAPLDLPPPKPARPKPSKEEVSRAVDLGRAAGFVSRDPQPAAEPVRDGRRRRKKERDQILVHGPKTVIDRFRSYCDAREMTYWEALDAWLTAAEQGREGG